MVKDDFITDKKKIWLDVTAWWQVPAAVELNNKRDNEERIKLQYVFKF